MAGVGIYSDLEPDIIKEILKLKSSHNINMDELKGSRLYNKKGKFIYELIKLLYTNKCPLFVELMDKKYFLAITLTNTLLFHPGRISLTKETATYGRLAAAILHECLPDAHFEKYCQLCISPTKEAFENFMESLKKEVHGWEGEQKKVSEYLIEDIEDTMNYYTQIANARDSPRPPHSYFLPLPDYDKNYKFLALLPHVYAISNICARVEKYRVQMGIKNVEIIHDELYYFDKTIVNSLNEMKTIPSAFQSDFIKEKGKFDIPDEMDIQFAASNENIMIQVADVLASGINKMWRDIQKKQYLDGIYYSAMKRYLLKYPSMYGTFGINFLVPMNEYEMFISEF